MLATKRRVLLFSRKALRKRWKPLKGAKAFCRADKRRGRVMMRTIEPGGRQSRRHEAGAGGVTL